MLYSDYQIRNKKGLFFAAAPQTLVDDYIHFLETIGLTPQLVTSLLVAITNTMFFMTQKSKDSKGSKDSKDSKDSKGSKGSKRNKEITYNSFLYITPNKGWLIIANQDNFFSREIILNISAPKEQDAASSENFVARPTDSSHNVSVYQNLILEVARSFLYIKQQEQGAQISSLMVSSSEDLPEEIIKGLNNKLQLPVNLLDPAKNFNLEDGLKKDAQLPQKLKKLPIALGLLVDTNNHISINLVPLKVRDHKKQATNRLLVIFFLIGYCILAGAGYVGLNWAQANYQLAANSQQQSILQLKPAYEQAKRDELARYKRDFHLSVLKRFEKTGPLWRGVLYEFSLLSQPNMIFSSMDITKSKGSWRFKAKGNITAKSSKQAKQQLKKFLESLRESAFFNQPRAKNITMRPKNFKAGGTGPASTGTQLNFHLSCNMLH